MGHRAARSRGDADGGVALSASGGTTPSQTVGPYFGIGLPFAAGPDAVSPDTTGAIRVTGTMYDGESAPVPDALIETWQVTPRELWARASCEDTGGTYSLVTLRPDGATPWIDVSVFARGLLHRLVTRMYFAAGDVPDIVPGDRRDTLVAQTAENDGYRFDIHLQGPGETVFFDV